MPKSKIQVGITGEYLALAKLTERGYVAALTQKNTENIDVLCANPDNNRAVCLQIKTTANKSDGWVISRKAERLDSPNLFYIFINIYDPNNPSYHIINARDLAKQTAEGHKQWLNTPNKTGGKHNDNDIRTFFDRDGKYRDNWKIIEDYLK